MKDYQPSLAARCIAEFVGTFFLVYTVAMNALTESVGGAIAVGAILTAMLYSLGPLSGGHFNPAVTLSLWLSGRRKISAANGLCYAAMQTAGAVCASFVCQESLARQLAAGRSALLVPGPGPGYSEYQVLAIEVLYTFALCYVVLNVATTESKENGSAPNAHFGIAVGFTVTSAAIAIAPVSGCSLNPALSLAAALSAWLMSGGLLSLHVWAVYAVAPFLGAFVGAACFWVVRGGVYKRYEYTPSAIFAEAEAEETSDDDYDIPQPTMDRRNSIPLSRLAPIRLPEEAVDTELVCSLSWEVRSRTPNLQVSCDCDLTCVKYNRAGDCLGAVYFANTGTHESLRHSGDEVTGSSQSQGARSQQVSEQISLRLSEVKASICVLAVVVIVYTAGKSFDDITKYCLTLSEKRKGGREFCHYDKPDSTAGKHANIAALLYRMDGGWYVKAIDESYSVPPNSTYRAILGELKAQVSRVPGIGVGSHVGSLSARSSRLYSEGSIHMAQV